MILQNDGSLMMDPAPRNNIHGILREYSRVIKDIDIALHTNNTIQHILQVELNGIDIHELG